MEFGDIDLYLPILVIFLILVWAACIYQKTRQSATILPYKIIKSDPGSSRGYKDNITFTSNLKSQRVASNRTDSMKTSGALCLSLFGLYCVVTAYNDNANHVLRRQASATNSSSVLVDFEVYKPVEFDPQSQECNQVIVLMEHSFGYSYGQPFVGEYLTGLLSKIFVLYNGHRNLHSA